MIARRLTLPLALAISLLLVGCSKQSALSSATPKNVNLGTVELAYGTPNRQDLGDKLACVLTAQPLSPGSIELVATLEQAGKQLSVTRVAPAPLDQPLHLVFGSCQVDVTPHVKK